ncbi:hypothetical protein Vi05172_g1852 [Venturia inaequalis]|nr:hypothetical protein Vi05172_g1852 [Venturia inaequalis]
MLELGKEGTALPCCSCRPPLTDSNPMVEMLNGKRSRSMILAGLRGRTLLGYMSICMGFGTNSL